MHGAEDVTVVGHGNGRHAELLHAMAELFYVAGAVEQRVIGVEMQVNELGHGLSLILREIAGIVADGMVWKTGSYAQSVEFWRLKGSCTSVTNAVGLAFSKIAEWGWSAWL